MTTKQLPTTTKQDAISKLVLTGDIGSLNDTEKLDYYKALCERVGLDWTTRPFDYLVLQGKKVLYLNKGGAEQLNQVHNVTHEIMDSQVMPGGIYKVTVRAYAQGRGRWVDSTGCVNIDGLRGDNLANAYMKGETKAKRRATLSLFGLGVLDETETETIHGAVTEVAVFDAPKQIPQSRQAASPHNEVNSSMPAGVVDELGYEGFNELLQTAKMQSLSDDKYKEVLSLYGVEVKDKPALVTQALRAVLEKSGAKFDAKTKSVTGLTKEIYNDALAVMATWAPVAEVV